MSIVFAGGAILLGVGLAYVAVVIFIVGREVCAFRASLKDFVHGKVRSLGEIETELGGKSDD